jgi:hypothetical protein
MPDNNKPPFALAGTMPGDLDQARAMMARCRLNRTGQGQLGDDEHASAAS